MAAWLDRLSRHNDAKLATVAKIPWPHLLQEASWNLSAISYCIASVGRDLAGKPNNPAAMDSAGQALEWLADEMQRRCVAIDEGLS
ncbi:hypothetical protein HK16_06540 [Acetobacter senegalensis]|uniref:Uncharacterized protein n=2 Tax=Acetobacter TaxID=434 RepID=A0A252EKN9_9PROT|nr:MULTISPECIES: hypothetical protein [Acetobacter]ATJ90002.1 hypothetical protein CIW82_04150 [Acetobacter tropicalis]OUL66988.1 hypothetical protein HK16_06540 [Acetobacter senegalensis]